MRQDVTSEIWKEIPGLEGRYQASSEGRIRSMDQYINQRSKNGTIYQRFIKGRILRPAPSHGGYLGVNIGHSEHRTVHSLVALAYHGDCPEGHEIRHLNGNNQDNRPDNLCYGSHLDNERDKYQNDGRRLKLTENQVKEIKRLFQTTALSNVAIGKMYAVSDVMIGRIRRKESFAWVE